MTGNAPAPAPSPFYRPSWICLAVLVVLGALTYLRLYAYPQGQAFWMQFAPAWLWVCGMVLIAYLLTALLWLPSARERATYDLVFLALLTIGGLGMLIQSRNVQVAHDAEVTARLAETRRTLATSGPRLDRRTEDWWEGVGGRFERYASNLDRAIIDNLRELDRMVLEDVGRSLERWLAADTAISGMTPDTWLRRTTRADLEADRDKLAQAYAAIRALLDQVESLEERYLSELDKLELDDRARRIAIAELERILQDPNLLLIETHRTLELDIVSLLLEAINTLLAHWGRWRFDAGVNRLTFEQPAVEAAFFGTLAEVEIAAEAVRRAEAEARQARRLP